MKSVRTACLLIGCVLMHASLGPDVWAAVESERATTILGAVPAIHADFASGAMTAPISFRIVPIASSVLKSTPPLLRVFSTRASRNKPRLRTASARMVQSLVAVGPRTVSVVRRMSVVLRSTLVAPTAEQALPSRAAGRTTVLSRFVNFVAGGPKGPQRRRTWLRRAKIAATTIGVGAVLVPSSVIVMDHVMSNPNRVASPTQSVGQKKPTVTAALIGDSLSRPFDVGSIWSIINGARWDHWHNWFLDPDSGPDGVNSLYKRMSADRRVIFTNYASVAAAVDGPGMPVPSWSYKIAFEIDPFSAQVDALLRRPFPDLTLLFIGNTNVDYVRSRLLDRSHPKQRFAKMVHFFSRAYAHQLSRLIRRATIDARQDGRVRHIVVFGLVNFSAYFKARAQAEERARQNHNLYPGLTWSEQIFPSLRRPYRAGMIELAQAYNAAIQEIVTALPPNRFVVVIFSNAMSKLPLKLQDISAGDAWHASRKGHALMAEVVYKSLETLYSTDPKPKR